MLCIKKVCRCLSSHTKTRRQTYANITKCTNLVNRLHKKVQSGIFKFPDFTDKCPICHGKDCAIRMGYYYRLVLLKDDETGNLKLLTIPVARFRCRKKRNPIIHHRTFSLLPEGLIPYNKIHIDLLMLIYAYIFIMKLTIPKTLNKLDSMSTESIMLSEKTIQILFMMLEQIRIKLIIFFKKMN